jgi:hypothetical protein
MGIDDPCERLGIIERPEQLADKFIKSALFASTEHDERIWSVAVCAGCDFNNISLFYAANSLIGFSLSPSLPANLASSLLSGAAV